MIEETIYERSIDPNACCDIGLHLPFLRAEAHGEIVEIGVRGGSSTAALLLGIKERGGHLYSIDVNPLCGEIFEGNRQWTFIHGHSVRDHVEILAKIPEAIDVLFIDADHTYEATLHELSTFGPLVRPGGVIMLHDTELHGAGVILAVIQYQAHAGGRLELKTGSYGLGVIRV